MHTIVPAGRLLDGLMRATRAMEAANGDGPTNEETCAAVLYPALGQERSALEPVFARF
jgi:hypothetical protein